LYDLWVDAEKLTVVELNSFEREYVVTCDKGIDYTVSLLLKTCNFKVFDIQKYPCIHALPAFISILDDEDWRRGLELHDLVTKYYWAELWALAYYRTIYFVPDKSQWEVPDEVKVLKIDPLS